MSRNYAKIPIFVLSFCMTLFALRADCQTIIMSANGSDDTTMSYAEVYDDGGPTGPYSSSCNASYTFHTVSPTGRYRIELESQLTHPQGNACLRILNNSASGSAICINPPDGDGVYTSNGNTVTLLFHADDDYPTQGFKVILCEFSQAIPTNIRSDYLDSNTVKLEWDEPSNDVVWLLDYAIVPESVGTAGYFDNAANPRTTVQLSVPEYTIVNIPVGDRVVYRLLSQGASGCYSPSEGLIPPYQVPVVCPCIKPLDATVVSLDDSVRISWTSDSPVSFWHIFSVDPVIDTFLPGDVFSIVIPYDFPCYGGLIMINGNCHDSTCNSLYVELPRGGCIRSVGFIQRNHTDGHSIDISWYATDNPLDKYLLFLRMDGEPPDSNRLIDTFSHDITSYTIEGLRPHTKYRLSMFVLCEGLHLACFDVSTMISTTIDGCIDFIDFYDPGIHMTNGSYDNPLSTLSYGDDRHRCILDSSLRDPLTGNMLRQVPPGEEVSFRLGDENVGAQGETVTFDYLVDTLDKDMLLVKYAVVLQNPNHNSSNQPHFTLEILDNSGSVVDTQCCYADFFAAGDLGWNSVAGSNIIWKDWTNVGIDISAYHGQNIHVRFTTKDCADGGHFGYAYFTVACDNRRIALVNLCDSQDSVRLRAPQGYDYRWERLGDTSIISTSNEIMVAADSSNYICHCTFLGKAECGFTVYATALLPKPKAEIGYHIDTCRQKIYLYNRCHIDIDSAILHLVRQSIVDVDWYAGVSPAESNRDTIVLPIDAIGTHTVSVRCRLSDSHCADSSTLSFTVDCYHRQAIDGPTDICNGDAVTLLANLNPIDHYLYHWNDGSSSLSKTFVPSADTIVSLITTWYAGVPPAVGDTLAEPYHCIDTVYHSIVIHPVFDDTVAVVICQGDYDTLGFSIDRDTPSGFHTNMRTSQFGCDSLFTIDLRIMPSYFDTLHVVTCDESYSDYEFAEDSTGIYAHSYRTAEGCDSMLVLDLLRHRLTIDTFECEIVQGDIYSENGFNESQTGFYQAVYIDRYGCDSTLNLDLHVVALRFPNVVTPNGDGINDMWGIVGLSDAREFEYYSFWIYDRWGRLIHSSSKEYFWNPNKTHTPTGTYFYVFQARHSSGRVIDHKGVIEVVDKKAAQ